MKNKKINYLFYVRYALDILTVYRCNTNDPFHVMGEIIYRSMLHVERIDFVEETPERVKYWKDNYINIEEFKLKYENGSGMYD